MIDGQDGPQRQHDAGEFPSRSDLFERPGSSPGFAEMRRSGLSMPPARPGVMLVQAILNLAFGIARERNSPSTAVSSFFEAPRRLWLS